MLRRRHVRMLPLCAFLVLVSIATAHAECAWVLWVYPLDKGARLDAYSIAQLEKVIHAWVSGTYVTSSRATF
jgi:hypothetical protein